MLENSPPPDEWSRFSETCQRLRNLSGAQFEQLCDAILLKRSRRSSEILRLIPGGLTYVRALTPRQGPVDAALTSPVGTLLAGFGVIADSGGEGWLKKLKSDINKIRAAAKEARLTNATFLFMTTADAQPEAILAAQEQYSDDRVLRVVQIDTLRTIGEELSVTDVDLALRFLGIPIPIGRFVPLSAGTAEHRPDLPLPRRTDFQRSLVCLPDAARDAISVQLAKVRRCVLWAAPSSGKTWMAAAYSEWAERNSGIAAYYVDAATSVPGDGRVWWRELVLLDSSGPILVIDNCHEGAEEVDEFCRQCDGAPGRISLACIILIGTGLSPTPFTPLRESPIAEWQTRYTVSIDTAAVWPLMVEAYANHLKSMNARKYADITEDLEQNKTIIETHHAHDLAASRARLEAWADVGGSLSKVSDDTFYAYLESRYLGDAAELMSVACALWSYEIPVHQRFFEGELQPAASTLLGSGMLSEDDSKRVLYGRCLRPIFHRNLAKEVFTAWLRRDNPLTAQSMSSELLVTAIRRYLLRRPLNFARVYEKMHRAGDLNIVASLMADPEVVQAGLSTLEECPARDVVLFATLLQPHAPGKVTDLLQRLRDNPDALVAGLQATPVVVLLASISALRRLDGHLVKDIVQQLDPRELAGQLTRATLRTVGNCLNTLSREQYPDGKLTLLVSLLSPSALSSREYEGGLQSLCWLARSLDRYTASRETPRQQAGEKRRREGAGQDFLRALGGRRLAEIWRRRPAAGPLELFIGHSARDIREETIRALSDDELCTVLRDGDLKDFANLMHWYPLFRRGYQKLRSTGELRSWLVSSTAAEIGLCLHICRQPHNSPTVARELLREVVAGGRHDRFLEKEDLLAFALLLHHATQIESESAKRLAAVLLDAERTRRALVRSSLNGIQLLIYNLAQLRTARTWPTPVEQSFAQELVRTDLSEVMDAAPLRITDHFTWNVYDFVDKGHGGKVARALLDKLVREVWTAPLEDVARATWTLAKILNAAVGVIPRVLPALRHRIESVTAAELAVVLPLVGCLEFVSTGTTQDWSLPIVERNVVCEAVEKPLSAKVQQPVLSALMLVGAARIIGPAGLREGWSSTQRSVIEKSLRAAVSEIDPRAQEVVLLAIHLLTWVPPER